MATKVTCIYTANAESITPTNLALLIKAPTIPVDSAILAATGATVFSDTTVHSDSPAYARRTIVFNITAAVTARFPTDTDKVNAFTNCMTPNIQAGAATRVIASTPTLS